MFEWVKKLFTKERKAMVLPRLPLPTESSVDDMTLVKWALMNPYVVSIVEMISNAVANLPFEYDGKEVEKLFEKPNEMDSQMDFLKKITKDLMYYGNAYVLLATVRGKLKEMWNLPPYAVKLEVDRRTGEVKNYRYSVNGIEETYQPEQIIHFKISDPLTPIYGRSPLRTIEFTLQQFVYMKMWNISLLKNHARPSGAFILQGTLTEKQYNRLKKQIKEEMAGSENAGEPLILEGGLDWKSLSLNPSELDWLETQRMLVREIAVAFGVAPELLGDSENKTYSNFQEARRQFYYNTVLPLAETIIYDFNKAFARFGMGKVEILYSDIDALSEDVNETTKRVIEGVKAGVLTVNEARAELGLDPVKGGNQIFMPATLIPMLAGMEELKYED